MTSSSTDSLAAVSTQTREQPYLAADEQLPAVTGADQYLGHAEELLENALLYVDVDRGDPQNSTYSVDQILDLWNWYKQKTGQNIEAYGRFLNRPFTPEEKEELEHLASRMGWGSADTPSSSPFAWKYKKLTDLETVQEAAKHVTPEMREAYLASKNAPLDVISAKAIDMTPEAVIQAADKAAAAAEAEAQQEFHKRNLSSYYNNAAAAVDLSKYVAEYSEDSEWWPGWKDVSYADLPSQPFLRGLTSMLMNQAQESAQAAPSGLTQSTAVASGTDDDDPEAVLWRALPLDLDPFVVLNQGRTGRQAVAAQQQNEEEARWAARKRAFLLSTGCVLGFAAFRWLRRRMAARRRQEAAKLRQSVAAAARLPAA